MMGERMKKYPPYSVLLSVYNKEKPDYLEESLNCVFSQNIFPDEVILIEDGNLTDGLYAVINRYKEKFPKTLKIFPFKNNYCYPLNFNS